MFFGYSEWFVCIDLSGNIKEPVSECLLLDKAR